MRRVKPTRAAQPYRTGSPLRQPGPALDAMLKGRSAHGTNPQDIRRATHLIAAAKAVTSRPKRPARPQRPVRPPR